MAETYKEHLGIAVQPRVGQDRQKGGAGCEPARAGEPRGEIEHEHRAERDQRDGQKGLAEQVVAEGDLKRARQVVLEKEPDVEEVADGHIAQQDLAGARQVLEVIVREFNGEPAEKEGAGEHPEIQDAERNPPESRESGVSVGCTDVHVAAWRRLAGSSVTKDPATTTTAREAFSIATRTPAVRAARVAVGGAQWSL